MTHSADSSNRARLRALIGAKLKIPAPLIEEMMANDDREEQAGAYDCLGQHWNRIHPEMETWCTMPLVLGFLFRSITSPLSNDDLDSNVLSSYEAARELLGILQSHNGHSESESIVADLIKRVDQTFLAGDESVRACIETGFLEHALEYPELRKHFAHWADHAEMREAHRYALAWGLAHEQSPD